MAFFGPFLISVAWKDRNGGGQNRDDDSFSAYQYFYECSPCAEGCDTCVDSSPCLASYDWTFRYTVHCIAFIHYAPTIDRYLFIIRRYFLLVISLICALLTLILIGLVYKYRKLKVS